MQIKAFYCQHCRSHEAYCSRPRNSIEIHVLPLLLLRPVRCKYCDRRYYRSLSVPVSERACATEIRSAAA